MFVDGESNLLLLSSDRTRLTKYFSAWNYDSLLVLGGKSHRSEGFLELCDLDVSNRQTIYLLDRGKQRISVLHPNLRVMQDLSLAQLGSPAGEVAPELQAVSVAANSAGELYVLNALDNQIYLLSNSGEWTFRFGGTNYGQGSLFQPAMLRLSSRNDLIVAEPEAGRLLVYDPFGTFRFALKPETGHPWHSFQIIDPQTLLLIGKKAGSLVDLRTGATNTFDFPLEAALDVAWNPPFVYFLTENAVHLYPIPTW